MVRTHRVVLSYTNSDDGVWVDCDCGWSRGLGFNPTALEALAAENVHLLEVAKEELDEGAR